MSTREAEVETGAVERKMTTQVVRNSLCPGFPDCMDPGNPTHSPLDHLASGFAEETVVQGHWVAEGVTPKL